MRKGVEISCPRRTSERSDFEVSVFGYINEKNQTSILVITTIMSRKQLDEIRLFVQSKI